MTLIKPMYMARAKFW